MATLPVRPPEWIPTAPLVNRATRRMPADADTVWQRVAVEVSADVADRMVLVH